MVPSLLGAYLRLFNTRKANMTDQEKLDRAHDNRKGHNGRGPQMFQCWIDLGKPTTVCTECGDESSNAPDIQCEYNGHHVECKGTYQIPNIAHRYGEPNPETMDALTVVRELTRKAGEMERSDSSIVAEAAPLIDKLVDMGRAEDAIKLLRNNMTGFTRDYFMHLLKPMLSKAALEQLKDID